jgi:hypothetical protein
MADVVRGVKVVLSAQDNLSRGLGSALGSLRGMALGMGGLGTAGLGALSAMVVRSARFGDEMGEVATRVGVSVEALSTLRYAAEMNKTSFEALQVGLRGLTRTAYAASTGNAEAADVFKKLGVSVTDSQGKLKPMNELLLEVADGLKGTPNLMERGALSMKVFGRAGTGLLPMLSEGSAKIAEYQQKARDLGLELSTKSAEGADQFVDSLGTLKQAVGGLSRQFADTLIPQLTTLATKASDIIGHWNRWSKAHEGLSRFLTSTFAEGSAIMLGLSLAASMVLKIRDAWGLVTGAARTATLAQGVAAGAAGAGAGTAGVAGAIGTAGAMSRQRWYPGVGTAAAGEGAVAGAAAGAGTGAAIAGMATNLGIAASSLVAIYFLANDIDAIMQAGRTEKQNWEQTRRTASQMGIRVPTTKEEWSDWYKKAGVHQTAGEVLRGVFEPGVSVSQLLYMRWLRKQPDQGTGLLGQRARLVTSGGMAGPPIELGPGGVPKPPAFPGHVPQRPSVTFNLKFDAAETRRYNEQGALKVIADVFRDAWGNFHPHAP